MKDRHIPVVIRRLLQLFAIVIYFQAQHFAATPLPNDCDYCILQFPASLSAVSGATTEPVYGRVFEAGVTEAEGPSPMITAQVGFGPVGSDPRSASGWTYFDATFNVQIGNDDEYQATMVAPGEGSYRYVFRFSFDAGANWSYADLDGAGSNPGLTFDPNNIGTMNTSPSSVPTQVGNSASSVMPTAATLNGTGNPNGGITTGWFRYSTTHPGTCNDTFGVRTPASGGLALGSGTAAVPFSQALSGLMQGTTYYFCAIVSNSLGTTFGSLASFTTPYCPVTITPDSQYFGPAAGNGSIGISSQGTCAWSAVSNVPWITITSNPPSGSGNGSIAFSITANPNNTQRTGTVTINDQTFTVIQAPGDCVMAFPGGADLPTGTTGSIGITVGDMTGRGAVSFSMTLTYDPSVATFAGVENAGTMSSGFTVGANTISPGSVRVVGYGTNPLSGAGNLINLRFTASGPIGSTSPLTFTEIYFNESGCVQVMGAGQITIVGRTVSGLVLYGTSPTTLGIAGVRLDGFGSPSGSAFTDANGAYSITGLGTGALTLVPSLPSLPAVNGITAADASLVLQAVLGLATLTPNQAISADVSGNGMVTPFDAALIAKYAVGLPNTVYAGTWRFAPGQRNYASLPNDLTDQNFALILMGEVTGNWTPSAPFGDVALLTSGEAVDPRPPVRSSIKLSLPSLAVPNGTILIPLTLGNYNGQIVTSYQFDLIFDPNVLVPNSIPIDVTDSLSDGYAFEFNSLEPGRLRVAVYGVNPIAGNGTLVNLRFNVIGPYRSRSDLVLEETLLNEGQPTVIVQNGRLTVKR